MMDSFGIDLDRVLDEFEESEGNQLTYGNRLGSSLNSNKYEPADLDLSDADFAPACSSTTAKHQSDVPVSEGSTKHSVLTDDIDMVHSEKHFNNSNELNHLNGALNFPTTHIVHHADNVITDTLSSNTESTVGSSHSIRQSFVDDSTAYAEQILKQLDEEENASFIDSKLAETVSVHSTSEHLVNEKESNILQHTDGPTFISNSEEHTEPTISSSDCRNNIATCTAGLKIETSPNIKVKENDDFTAQACQPESDSNLIQSDNAAASADTLDNEITLIEAKRVQEAARDKNLAEKMDDECASLDVQNDGIVEDHSSTIEADYESETADARIKSDVHNFSAVSNEEKVLKEDTTEIIESSNVIISKAEHFDFKSTENKAFDKVKCESDIARNSDLEEMVDDVSNKIDNAVSDVADPGYKLKVDHRVRETVGDSDSLVVESKMKNLEVSTSSSETNYIAIDQVQLTETLQAKQRLLVSDTNARDYNNLSTDSPNETTNSLDRLSGISDHNQVLDISPSFSVDTTVTAKLSVKADFEENYVTLNECLYDKDQSVKSNKDDNNADTVTDCYSHTVTDCHSHAANDCHTNTITDSIADTAVVSPIFEDNSHLNTGNSFEDNLKVETIDTVCDTQAVTEDKISSERTEKSCHSDSKVELFDKYDSDRDDNDSSPDGDEYYIHDKMNAENSLQHKINNDENSLHGKAIDVQHGGLDTAENFGESFYNEMMAGSLPRDQDMLHYRETISGQEFSFDDEALNFDSDELIQSIVNNTVSGLDFLSEETDLPLRSEENFVSEAEISESLSDDKLSADSKVHPNIKDSGVTGGNKVIDSGQETSENATDDGLYLDNVAIGKKIVHSDDPTVHQSNSSECVDRTNASASLGARAKVPIVRSRVPDEGEWQGITTALQAAESLQYVKDSSNDQTPVTQQVEPVNTMIPQQIEPVSPVLPQPQGPPLCANMNIVITQLGKISPVWLADSEASNCMECEIAFSFTKRRHHCRACGKIFCSSCCNLKVSLEYMEKKEGRVCSKCYQDLIRAQCYERIHPQTAESPVIRPNPNNPVEYCSTIPPSLQAAAQAEATPPLSVMVPTGVLRKQGSIRQNEPKQVMFSDGIRPGGDLTELDGPSEPRIPVQSSSRRTKRIDKSGSRSSTKTKTVREAAKAVNLLPADGGLPPIMGSVQEKDSNSPTQEYAMELIKSSDYNNPVIFALNHNLTVMITIVDLSCCVSRRCWCFTTRGMCTVSQDEIVILLEYLPDESSIPVDILAHLCSIYDEAGQGNVMNNLGFSLLPPNTLGNPEHSGFLFVRQTFQCLLNITLPEPPYLFGILLQKWEIPWAKTFPLRLMLRLGAEFRYYPCPLISVRGRVPVYGEIGHTIMNLLVDFHNYQYTLPVVPGLVIHMEDERTSVTLPKSSYDQITKVLSSSDEHVMAFGATFSQSSDSHLVCLQSEDGNYQTQAINIQNRPRKVTGACFIVFNGALKSSSGLSAKSSIIEDGIMVQISSESMIALKQSLRAMKDYTIDCGSIGQDRPSEIVSIQWSDSPIKSNVGVRSPIDGTLLEDLPSMRINAATDYAGEGYTIRWTELFFMKNDEEMGEGGRAGGRSFADQPDVNRLADSLAQACSLALTTHLSHLTFESLTRIGLRVSISSEQVGYEVGSLGARLPDVCMNDLDEKLIPVIHGAASPGRPDLVLELIFHILQHRAVGQQATVTTTEAAPEATASAVGAAGGSSTGAGYK